MKEERIVVPANGYLMLFIILNTFLWEYRPNTHIQKQHGLCLV
jgi:hypothetical protein